MIPFCLHDYFEFNCFAFLESEESLSQINRSTFNHLSHDIRHRMIRSLGVAKDSNKLLEVDSILDRMVSPSLFVLMPQLIRCLLVL